MAACPSRDLAALRGAGIDVVTHRPRLAARFERYLLGVLAADHEAGGRATARGMPVCRTRSMPGPTRSAFGAWARLLNFKADHRKVIIGDDGKGGITGIVTSANPHDASSLHSNVGLKLSGAALSPLLDERARAGARRRLERQTGRVPEVGASRGRVARRPRRACRCSPKARSAPRSCAISPGRASATASTSRCSIYPSAASSRRCWPPPGAASRCACILDPNKDAFGRSKNGIPNRSVATELAAASDGAIKVRWFRTHGEQFHSKLVAMRTATEFWFTLGSANLTRRNLEDFNLEANVAASVPLNAEIAHADQQLVRIAVDQPRSAGARVHGGIRHLRRSVAGHLLALPPDGSHGSIDFLKASSVPARRDAAAAALPEFVHRRRSRRLERRDDLVEAIFARPPPIPAL